MKMTNKIIEEVVAEAVGSEVVPLVRALAGKRNVSEFKLAEKLDIEVNATRNLLYKLQNVNLVSFIRRKDKKKGWYIYYWTFKAKRARHLLVELKKKRLSVLRERLNRERGGCFFVCKNRCIRLDFEQAISFEFKCPECGSLMNQEDNTKKIKEIEKEIAQLEKGG